MNAVDASDHYNQSIDEPPPSLLNIVLDTNPYAWAHLASSLPLHQAIANLLVFINAHLAFSNANRVSVIASHLQLAEFLYPTSNKQYVGAQQEPSSDGDVEMANAAPSNGTTAIKRGGAHTDDAHLNDPNFYKPFAAVSSTLTQSLTNLLSRTMPQSGDHGMSSHSTTSLAGALTLALAYTNKTSVLAAPVASSELPASHATGPTAPGTSATNAQSLTSRILVLSASAASPSQYIPLMNAIFAAQRQRIAIDVLALTPGSSSFLQQAADATQGIYLRMEHPHGFLQTLLQAFLPSFPSRALLIPPGQVDVDFRAACFCHRKVVDLGFVCSICLSIFCEPPLDEVCLTCGTRLRIGNYGAKPAVIRKKKKKKVRENGDSRMGTPTPGATR